MKHDPFPFAEEIKANELELLKARVKKLFPSIPMSDSFLDILADSSKVADMLGLDLKEFLQPEVDKQTTEQKKSIALSNIGHPIPGCKFGYTYGSHPDATDAQIAAGMGGGGKSPSKTRTGATPKAAKGKDNSSAQSNEPDASKEVAPNRTRKPSYANKDARQKDIARLRDLILAETSNPKEMEAVAASVVNRFQPPKENFGVKNPKTYSDVIDAGEGKKEQFQGFCGGKTPGKVEDIKNSQNPADKENVATATGIAEKAVGNPDSIKRTIVDKDGNPHYVYSFMTKGDSPSGRAKLIDVGVEERKHFGNDYFYHSKQ